MGSMRTKTLGWIAAAAFGTFGCGSEAQYSVCANDFDKSEMVEFLNGNLVVVAGHVEHGASKGRMVGGLVFGLVLNGVDFSNLDYEARFANGSYEITNGDESLGFRLYFAASFGEYAAGEQVPYSVFDPESFVENLRVTNIDVANGRASYDYDEGPLYGLVDGELDVDVDDLAGVHVRLKIRAEMLAFEAFSEGTYRGRSPRDADELRVVMTTTRAPLLDVYNRFLAGEYGFRYTGTTYDSSYYGIDQEFTDSIFLMGNDGNDGWTWTGEYASTVRKDGLTLYQRGFVSNLDQNYTEYYCDDVLAERAGVARHALDLQGGTFVLEDGSTLSYGLAPF
jgi:hypothetical protein